MLKITLNTFQGGLFTSQYVRHSTSAFFLFFLCKSRNLDPLHLPSRETLRVVIVRGLIGFAFSISSGTAIANLHITDFTSIYRSYPAHVLVLSWLFFGEAFTLIKLICLIMGYLGVLFIVRPEFLFGAIEGAAGDISAD